MSEAQIEDVIEAPDELTALKGRADLLGIKYHPSISLEKLRDKVNAALSQDEEEKPEITTETTETASQKRNRLRAEANALVRIRVTV